MISCERSPALPSTGIDRRSFMTPRSVAAVALALSLAGLGCSTRNEPTSPALLFSGLGREAAPLGRAGDENPGFYPLAPGNRWRFAREFSMELRPAGQPPSRVMIPSTIRIEQTCNETVGRRSYRIERQQVEENGNNISTLWLRYRQDRGGLYE